MTRTDAIGVVIFLGAALIGVALILARNVIGPKWSRASTTFARANRNSLNGPAFMVLFGVVAIAIGLAGAAIAGGLLE